MISSQVDCEEVERACLDYLKRYHRANYEIKEIIDMPLTGKEISMSGADLYRFLLWLEERYEFYIPADKVRKEGFRTVGDVVSIVLSTLEERNEEGSCS